MRSQSRCEVLSNDRNPEASALSSLEGLIEVTSGAFLCRLQIWTEEQWQKLPEADRPLEYAHAPGLGWVGAVRVGCMN